MLLQFAVRNFRCFGDEAALSLISPAMRTAIPRANQTWVDCTERVAAIFGPNAAGKSTVLDAIQSIALALRTPGSGAIFQPSRTRPNENLATEYELGFVAEGTRYHYEVSAMPWGITHEALYAYPKGIARKMFLRTQTKPDVDFQFEKGTSLTGPTAEVRRITRSAMLFLATANRYGHPVLEPIARALLAGVGIDHISFRDRQDEEVLHRVVLEMIASPDTQIDLVQALVQAADLGIERIEVRSEEIPSDVHEKILRFLAALNEGEETAEVDIPRLRNVVVFVHRAENGKTFELPMSQQSSGTITWLTTAWHALDALRQGSTLLIDELDASLHPDLARYVVKLFQSPHLNPRGAQLIFTTHDVSLLGNAPTKLLEPRNVWFVEKDSHGRSELYSMDQFDNRAGNNSERRYMAGQFGAVPDIDDSLLTQYIGTYEDRLAAHG